MDSVLIGVYGASGFGREVVHVVQKHAKHTHPNSRVVFIDDGLVGKLINGYEVLSYSNFTLQAEASKKICLAIANSEVRKDLSQKLEEDGIDYFEVVDDSVLIMDEVFVGKGVILCPHVTITSNVKIGQSFHANIYSYIAHDCVIGDFVTFAPRVNCNGNVHIEDYAYIGTGAILKQGTPENPLVIGRGAVVGMGAVVTKNVSAGQVVVGNPAKPLAK